MDGEISREVYERAYVNLVNHGIRELKKLKGYSEFNVISGNLNRRIWDFESYTERRGIEETDLRGLPQNMLDANFALSVLRANKSAEVLSYGVA